MDTKNDAPRGQKTVTSAGGMRPAPLSEIIGPQGVAVTVCYVAAGAPLLVVPTLHGNDGVDGTTVSFLLAQSLELQKEEERGWKLEEHEAHMRELDCRFKDVVRLSSPEREAWRHPLFVLFGSVSHFRVCFAQGVQEKWIGLGDDCVKMVRIQRLRLDGGLLMRQSPELNFTQFLSEDELGG